jgi:hypothetical protein
MTTVVDLNPPAPGDELVRLVNNFGCDELNVDGRSCRPDKRHAFYVPRLTCRGAASVRPR